MQPEDPADEDLWTVERHLRAAPPAAAALYRDVETAVRGLGPVRLSVSRSSITFKGTRRGFAGARPTATGVVGYLDLLRELPRERRIRSVSPYQRNLFVHQFVLREPGDLDAEFVGWLREAYEVGCGAHLKGS